MNTETTTIDEVTPIAPAPQPLLMADAQVIRRAILEAIDESDDGVPWGKGFDHPFDSVKTDARIRFTNLVEDRIRALQGPAHNLGVKLENYCPRHMRARLPRPTASWCADCEAQ